MKKAKITVVPWDFSNHAMSALRYLLDEHPNDSIRVVCVLEKPNPYSPEFDWGPEVEENASIHCENKFRATTTSLGVAIPDFNVVFGIPSMQIAKFAEACQADRIVMSTHGRTGIQKLMMGSVAQQVVCESVCPVILLPNKWHVAHLATRDTSTDSSGIDTAGVNLQSPESM